MSNDSAGPQQAILELDESWRGNLGGQPDESTICQLLIDLFFGDFAKNFSLFQFGPSDARVASERLVKVPTLVSGGSQAELTQDRRHTPRSAPRKTNIARRAPLTRLEHSSICRSPTGGSEAERKGLQKNAGTMPTKRIFTMVMPGKIIA